MMNFHDDEVRRDPYPMYDQVRSGSPVLHEPRSDAWMIFDYEGAKRALHDQDAFSSNLSIAGHTSPEWFVFFDPPRHTKLRALITGAFTPRLIASLEPRIRALSSELLDRTIERGEMDLCADFSVPLPMMVIAQMLGIPIDDMPRFTRWSEVMLNLSYTTAGGEEAVRASSAFLEQRVEMSAYFAGLLEERRAAPRDDLLTRLADAEVGGERLSAEESLGLFELLLVAGSETTTNLLSNALLCFMENPTELARLRAAPELLPSAIEEILRYRSPVQWMFRATKRDVEVHGQVIPAGKLVLPMIGSANRDPQHFQGASRFDITRDPNPHIAFGNGIHFCLGAPLARLEARVALSELLSRVRGFAPASDEPWVPRKALHVQGPARLPIRFEPGRRASVNA